MKAMKKMFVLNLFLAAMGSVALADGNANIMTCVGKGVDGPNLFRDHQAVTVIFDENLEKAHLSEYRVRERIICGYDDVNSTLQKEEDGQVQPGCGMMTIHSSLGILHVPYDLPSSGQDLVILSKTDGTSEQLHCFKGAIKDVEEFLNNNIF